MVKELFIEKDWHRDGEIFHHKQVYNDGYYYIYEVTYGKYSKWHEVFKRKLAKDVTKVDGRPMRLDSLHVKYPSNEDFGNWAFGYNTFDECIECIKKWSQSSGI